MSEKNQAARDLAAFIAASPTAFQATASVAAMLEAGGFKALDEAAPFVLEKGGRYYVVRNSSSIIAFIIPEGEVDGMRCAAAHTDSPSFKIKPNPVDISSGAYATLNVESYGGAVYSSWCDRPLSIAGRVQLRTPSGIKERLVDFGRDLVSIVNLAIHQNRDVNDGVKISVQTDMKPILGLGCDKASFDKLLADELGVALEDVLSHDLFLYDRTPASIWGLDDAFISSGRLDDLMCAWSAAAAFAKAPAGRFIKVLALFDNEEVGSGSRQGALSDFLVTTWERICRALGLDVEQKAMLEARAIMVSADNCHALHPNHVEKCDPTNKPVINGGVCIKYSANQKYTTDSYSAAFLADLMDRNGIPRQVFVNNSDVRGGSTLGNLSAQKLSIASVDIGAAQLAMHSAWETAGTKDVEYLLSLFKVFFAD